ncbi:hypothetical protein AX17_003863, partial [Amanita inopinata Kibby_2008]
NPNNIEYFWHRLMYRTASGEFSDVCTAQLVMNNFESTKLVAMKMMRVFTSNSRYLEGSYRNKMLNLATQWHALSHENVMQCMGLAQVDYYLGFVLPLCQEPITTYVRLNPDVSKLSLLRQVAAGVEYLHSRNVVHTDIRGSNVLMNNGVPQLTDIGLTHIIDYHDFTAVSPFKRARWMGPDVLSADEGVEIYTQSSDVYALAMTILEVFSGMPPFPNRRSTMVVMRDVVNGVRPRRPEEPPIPDAVWCLLQFCWFQNPEERPSAYLVHSWLKCVEASEESK